MSIHRADRFDKVWDWAPVRSGIHLCRFGYKHPTALARNVRERWRYFTKNLLLNERQPPCFGVFSCVHIIGDQWFKVGSLSCAFYWLFITIPRSFSEMSATLVLPAYRTLGCVPALANTLYLAVQRGSSAEAAALSRLRLPARDHERCGKPRSPTSKSRPSAFWQRPRRCCARAASRTHA